MQIKNIQLNTKLKFRNQFIVTPEPVFCFPDWQQAQIDEENLFIYAHPDLGLLTISNNKDDINIALLGFIIDPNSPEKTDKDLLKDIISKTKSLDDFIHIIISLAGRYIFILNINGKNYFFHDTGGLRSIYYAVNEGKNYFATQPLLFNEIFPLEKSDNYDLFFNSNHVKKDIEYWVPSGVTLYKNVYHLVPNHYLDVSSLQQKRYWPKNKKQELDIKSGAEKAGNYLKSLVSAAGLRFQLALPLTAGVDSRILLSTTKSSKLDIFYYTSFYSRHDKNSYDIRVPKQILKKIKRTHNLIDCQFLPDSTFLEFYNNNIDLAHQTYARNAYGMIDNYPQNRVDMKGNVSEIARCVMFLDGNHPKITSLDQIQMYVKEFKEMPIIINSLEKWFTEAKEVSDKTGYEILDLFYWEIRTGSWYAQSNNETDIYTETFSPFNYRPLLETMLAVPAIYRKRESSIFHKKIVEYSWPELLYWPINLRWYRRDQLKYFLAHKFKQIGIYNFARIPYRFIHNNYIKLKKVLISK